MPLIPLVVYFTSLLWRKREKQCSIYTLFWCSSWGLAIADPPGGHSMKNKCFDLVCAPLCPVTPAQLLYFPFSAFWIFCILHKFPIVQWNLVNQHVFGHYYPFLWWNITLLQWSDSCAGLCFLRYVTGCFLCKFYIGIWGTSWF